ncbi:MAG: hypothetical protein WC775_02125 [Patescibacteria group bacterium]|jgi:hypothetical protein
MSISVDHPRFVADLSRKVARPEDYVRESVGDTTLIGISHIPITDKRSTAIVQLLREAKTHAHLILEIPDHQIARANPNGLEALMAREFRRLGKGSSIHSLEPRMDLGFYQNVYGFPAILYIACVAFGNLINSKSALQYPLDTAKTIRQLFLDIESAGNVPVEVITTALARKLRILKMSPGGELYKAMFQAVNVASQYAGYLREYEVLGPTFNRLTELLNGMKLAVVGSAHIPAFHKALAKEPFDRPMNWQVFLSEIAGPVYAGYVAKFQAILEEEMQKLA